MLGRGRWPMSPVISHDVVDHVLGRNRRIAAMPSGRSRLITVEHITTSLT